MNAVFGGLQLLKGNFCLREHGRDLVTKASHEAIHGFAARGFHIVLYALDRAGGHAVQPLAHFFSLHQDVLPGAFHILLNLFHPERIILPGPVLLRVTQFLRGLADNHILGSRDRGLDGLDRFLTKLRTKLLQHPASLLDEG